MKKHQQMEAGEMEAREITRVMGLTLESVRAEVKTIQEGLEGTVKMLHFLAEEDGDPSQFGFSTDLLATSSEVLNLVQGQLEVLAVAERGGRMEWPKRVKP